MQKGFFFFDGEFLYYFVLWIYDNFVICYFVNKVLLCYVKCMYIILYFSFE